MIQITQKSIQRLLAGLLCLVMVLSFVPTPVGAAGETSVSTQANETPKAVVVAASDLQGGKYEMNGKVLEPILAQIKEDYASVDQLLFPGDMTQSVGSATDSNYGADIVQQKMAALWSNFTRTSDKDSDNILFSTGNHDSAGFALNDAIGLYTMTDYYVYLINHEDFPEDQADAGLIQTTANNLKDKLSPLVNSGKPVFVINHLPLHYSNRSDNDYARYLVEAMNDLGEQGLDIIYLFGHNHSQRYDHYIGGAANFIAPGGTMLVPGSTSTYEPTTINFTYMNAGYVGYVRYQNGDYTADAGNTTSATVFEIYGDRVEIARYNSSGPCNVGNAGAITDDSSNFGQSAYKTETAVPTATLSLANNTVTVGDLSAAGGSSSADSSTSNGSSSGSSGVSSYTPPASYEEWTVNLVWGSGTDQLPQGQQIVIYNSYIEAKKDTSSWAVYKNQPLIFTRDADETATGVTDTDPVIFYTMPNQSWVMTDVYGSNWKSTSNGVSVALAYDESAKTVTLTVTGTVTGTDPNAPEFDLGGGETTDPTEPEATEPSTGTTAGNSMTAEEAAGIAGDGFDTYTVSIVNSTGSNFVTDLTFWYGSAPSSWTDVAGDLYSEKQTITFPADGSVTSIPFYVHAGVLNAMTGGWGAGYGNWESNADDLGYTFTVTGSGKALTITVTGTGTAPDPTDPEETEPEATEPTEPEVVDPTGVTLDKEEAILYVDGTLKLTATVLPENASNKTVSWQSSDNSVVRVGDNGVVLAVGQGTATITVMTENGHTDTFKVTVRQVVESDYPEFPDEGSVKIDKELDTTKYNYVDTGTARVDLSVTGVPAQTEMNLVLVLDASGSMRECFHGTDEGGTCADTNKTVAASTDYATCCPTREIIIESAVEKLINQLKQPVNGVYPDVDIAIATFNAFDELGYEYKVMGVGGECEGAGFQAEVNENELLLDFTDINKVDASEVIGKFTTTAGTNYDRAMYWAYRLLTEKMEDDYKEWESDFQNGYTKEGFKARDNLVLFMSDGTPYQYNYINGSGTYDGEGVSYYAQYYLTGQMDELLADQMKLYPDLVTDYNSEFQDVPVLTTDKKYDVTPVATEILADFKELYNPDGKLWMAEAIKGDPKGSYKIIVRDDSAKGYHVEYVNGLGATILGLGLSLDSYTEDIMKKIASSEEHFVSCKEGSAVEEFFGEFTSRMAMAGNAVFKDQMGTYFDLQMSDVNQNGTVIKPNIQVKLRELYLKQEVGEYATYIDGSFVTDANGDNILVTLDMVGTPKPEKEGTNPSVIETVTFNSDGTEAYSTLKSGDILNNKVICAEHFWYNTDTVNSVMIDTDGDGTAETALEPETFYWNVGLIPEDQLILSYDVYLTESMEGNRPQGNYDTNNYAELTYTNYLGHECKQEVPTPVLSWGQGTVGYGFYLVDANGNPIINQTSGATGSFEQSVKLTEIIYQSFYHNQEYTGLSVEELSKVLPKGYTLYDPTSGYKVQLNSNGSGFYNFTGNGTYVDGIESNPITGGTGENVNTPEGSYTTANTVVWFAVYVEIKAMPDTVVIDFGLPVDIHVLVNDVLMTTGNTVLAGIGPKTDEESTAALLPGFVSALDDLKYGTAEIKNNGAADINSAVIRYLLNSMVMDKEETFSYAAYYTGSMGTHGYYYADVTVIPATTIYFEDNFVDFKEYTAADGLVENNGYWTQVTDSNYDADADHVQDEDRPGKSAISSLDANRIYGYDPEYKNMSKYSLGSAMKARVSKGKSAVAEFTFNGTGFDIVSLTSNITGTILVDVYKASDYASKGFGATAQRSLVVDTYYGCVYENGEWHVDKKTDEGANALYQVPVMKVEDLPYGEYTAVIMASYAKVFDHQDKGYYDFYLDAIRIYDPANDGAENDVIEGAYVSDGEGWPAYQELRDMLISAKTFDSLKNTNDTVDGIIFIDGISKLQDSSASGKPGGGFTSAADQLSGAVKDYANFGPNNELYLAPDQAIAFQMNFGTNVKAVHLGIKSVGGTAKVKIYNAALSADTVANMPTSTLSTATDMYYDMTTLNGKTVVITNEGGTGDAVLSITNIKVTYSSEPSTQEVSGVAVSWASGLQALTSLTRSSTDTVTPEATEPEATEPEATEPEATEPEATEPEVTEPEATEPEATEPEATEPEATEPEATEPEATEPETTEPAVGGAENSVPDTGDNTRLSIWMAGLLISFLCACVLIGIITAGGKRFAHKQ